MALWMVRAGRTGEREQFAIDQGCVLIGWDEMPDLSTLTTREALSAAYLDKYPTEKAGKVINATAQFFAFAHRMTKGDLVILPLKSRSAIAIGTITGPYEHHPEGPERAFHRRAVKWHRTDLPRTALDQDLLYSIGAFLTVCQIKRHNAEARIRAMLDGKRAPPPTPEADDPEVEEDGDQAIDLEEAGRDRIVRRIQAKFCGHDLSRLIEGILVADGYVTKLSPPGADGGVDILAGAGPMGFGTPRLAVQVKSGDAPVDVTVLRGLQGSMQTFQADHGLLASWSGFKPT
ncbi:MAG: hypothetical protein RLZZ127_2302, partial [Planctomycetota bacterium]